jgi:hypothetical protein
VIRPELRGLRDLKKKRILGWGCGIVAQWRSTCLARLWVGSSALPKKKKKEFLCPHIFQVIIFLLRENDKLP